MTARNDDESVARRVLEHIANGTTDAGFEVWREPVENYRSAARLEAELALIRRTPVPLCPSAALRGPGSYLAREAGGTAVFAVRGADGVVRAFRNACRHRGAPVAKGTGAAKSFVCPYHAWTYELDGRLRHVPHESGFPGLDKGAHGLVPVHAQERLGLVFVAQDPSPADAAIDDLPDLLGPDQELFFTGEREIQANWKILLEASLEGYHIRFLHAGSFFPYGFDNLTLIDRYGRSSRITYPFRRIRKLEPLPPAERRVDGLLTYVWHLFPNVLVSRFSRHTNLIVLEPVAPDRTRQLTWSLTNAAGAEALREAERDRGFAAEGGTAEDRAVVVDIQRGLSSGANEFFTFGHYESAIVHFHRGLAAALA